jgi:hypothetical protein
MIVNRNMHPSCCEKVDRRLKVILVVMRVYPQPIHVSRRISSADATQAKGLLAFTPVGLPPTEHVCFFSWTHSFAKIQNAFEMNSMLSRL